MRRLSKISIISMDFIRRVVALLILFSLVQSKETVKVSKFIKLNEKMIYECVDIYKQPSLSHPLLKNHKIQMRPSFASSESKNQVKSKKYGMVIDCPNGTVPILKNTKEYGANAQYFTEKHLNPLTVERHEQHIAGVRSQERQGPYHGVGAPMSVHNLSISSGQSSYANIYVGRVANNTFNLIETGWMVNPIIFGDGRTWSYGYWKGAKGTGCFNTMCPGFIQVSKTEPLSGPIREFRDHKKRYINISIQQDKETGHWWTTDVLQKVPDIPIGYWPKELFDLISNDAGIVGAGGVVKASPSGINPPMGNGHLPTKNVFDAARIPDMVIKDSSLKFKPHQKFKLEMLLDSSHKCYGVRKGNIFIMFTYGGPGGDSCGI